MSDNTSDDRLTCQDCGAQWPVGYVERLEYENRTLKAGQALQLIALRDHRLNELHGEIERLKTKCILLEKQREEANAYGDEQHAEAERLRAACSKMNEEICQTLGSALGYPRFCDDQENFPGTLPSHGVAVGDHVAETLAMEAAELLTKALADNKRLNDAAAFHDAWKADAI